MFILRPMLLRIATLAWAISTSLTLQTATGANPVDIDSPLTKIAFGSCANQHNPCPIWGTIGRYDPNLLLLLGDTIYADLQDGRLKPATPDRIAQAYQELAAVPDFKKLHRDVPIMATWDDHDYGNNDAGVEWEHKDAAAVLFHDFFGTPSDSPLRNRKGVYDARVFGPEGKRVQVIMLDTRYFRSELSKGDASLPGFRARPYVAVDGNAATMLGETQWAWLEEQLRQPAELRILASSIQVLSDDHPFEKWGNMRSEQERLFELIRQCEASGVIIISGDRHLGEISVDPIRIGYPLYDVTASGLNQANNGWRGVEPNSLRVAALAYGNHFGAIEIDWDTEDPIIRLQLRHDDGEIAVQSRIPLSKLQAGPAPMKLPSGVLDAAGARGATVGEPIDVQFVVQGGRVIGERARILLNSDVDFRSDRNFTIVVNAAALTGTLAEANLDTFLKKTIRVNGIVSSYNGGQQLIVDSVEQIEILD